MKVIIGIFRSLALCFVVLMAVVSCGRKADYQELTGYAQGGTYSVKFNHSGVKTGISEIRKSVDSILTLVDTTLSGYNKGSQLSRFNAGVPRSYYGHIRRSCKIFHKKKSFICDIFRLPLCFPRDISVQAGVRAPCGG